MRPQSLAVMRWSALLVAALTALTAGCASVPEGLSPLDGNEAPPEPYYWEYRSTVAPQHERTYAVNVGPRAALLNATLALESRTNGLPLPDAAPAQLTLALLAPSGTVVRSTQLDMQRPSASILVEEFAERGAYTLRVHGGGASGDIEGSDYGSAYVLTVEVLHA